MPAHSARLITSALPDIFGLPTALPWYEVDRRQGAQSFPGDPARALLDLWPVFRRAGADQGAWSGDEPPIAVLTHCWRAFKKGFRSGPFCDDGQNGAPELRLDEDERGWFIQADFSLENGLPQELTLYWADLRHLPRLREYSRNLWDFASDGLALLLPLGIDTFERSLEWFYMCAGDGMYDGQGTRIAVCAGGGCEAVDAEGDEEYRVSVREESRQLEEDAPRVIGNLRARLSRKGLAGRFERRIRRAAVGPQWLEWGRHVLTAVRDLGSLWKLLDTEREEELQDFEGEYVAALFCLTWGSPRFLMTCEQGFNDCMNAGGVMMPFVSAKLRGSSPGTLERLRAKARRREAGLSALCEALWSFDQLAEQACGVIDDPR